VLGGDKYVVRDILFKFPRAESQSLFAHYPDPLNIANKIQGHEPKGLSAYFHWALNRGCLDLVSFPLLALIDYKGHRITAMTRLPIAGSSSLIYGSDNAGSNVRDSVPEWSAFIKEGSCALNLKPHFISYGSQGNKEMELSSCLDLEGHQGLDGRYYLLDYSRVFPCVYKEKAERETYDNMWRYYEMFRPEFLRS